MSSSIKKRSKNNFYLNKSWFEPKYGTKKTNYLLGKYLIRLFILIILSIYVHFSLDTQAAFAINLLLFLTLIINGAYSLLRLHQRMLLKVIEIVSKDPEVEKMAGRGGV